MFSGIGDTLLIFKKTKLYIYIILVASELLQLTVVTCIKIHKHLRTIVLSVDQKCSVLSKK
jgi:hypothetical protein